MLSMHQYLQSQIGRQSLARMRCRLRVTVHLRLGLRPVFVQNFAS